MWIKLFPEHSIESQSHKQKQQKKWNNNKVKWENTKTEKFEGRKWNA